MSQCSGQITDKMHLHSVQECIVYVYIAEYYVYILHIVL
jgi:hypothetical protein